MIFVVVFMFEVIQKLYDTETVIKFPNTKVRVCQIRVLGY